MATKNCILLLALTFAFLPTVSSANFFLNWTKFNRMNWSLFRKDWEKNLHDKNLSSLNGPTKKIDKKIMLSDIKGNVVPQAVYDLKDKLLNPEAYKSVGAEAPRGILLVGPPGVGKSAIARALAHELDAAFIVGNAATFMTMWQGSGADNVENLFQQAKDKLAAGAKHVIIFIDEIDSLGNRQASQNHQEAVRTINTLLTNMDGVNALDNVTVVAATNKIELIDDALKRSGRFDDIIEIPLPDEAGREEILIYYLNKKRDSNSHELDVKTIAAETLCMTGADLEGIVKKAATIAARNRHRTITQEDLNQAWKQESLNHSKRMSPEKSLMLRLG